MAAPRGTDFQVFLDVESFYEALLAALQAARSRISLMYFSFDHGEWSKRFANALAERAAAGVDIRLMVDGLGMGLDAPKKTLQNLQLLDRLRWAGIRVESFHPRRLRLGVLNRLHTKICAIDEDTAFVGGSNIGDHYLGWQDCNLRMRGALGPTLHRLFDYVNSHAGGSFEDGGEDFHLSRLHAGDAQIFLTLPRQRYDIRRALVKLILDADRSVHIRSWYFLPDKEILYALRSQAARGVAVNVLLSHRTRVRPVDLANHVHGHLLAQSGGQVHRYTGRYMHAKVAWNDHGDVLFGSANLDARALKDNFECSLVFRGPGVIGDLEAAFEQDAAQSILQTSDYFRGRPLFFRLFAYLSSLASPLM